jgi:CBS domain-containing protein
MFAWGSHPDRTFRSTVNFANHLASDPVRHAHVDERPLMVAPTDTLRDVLSAMRRDRKSTALVCQKNRLVGIFDDRDALAALVRRDYLESPIADLMVTEVVSVRASDSVAKAIDLMSEHSFRRLPMVDDQGRAVGLVKVSGILHYLVEHFRTLVYNLPPEPHHRSQSREGA